MKGLILGIALASAGFAAVSQAHGVAGLVAGQKAAENKGHGGAGHGPLGGCDCRVNLGNNCCG